ncbi:MAG: hypothetical protein HKN76_02300, partial [Saprospiraceae bacterium]|nr:hypothetical protein [Saprospiraceae bacterium]
SELAYQTYLELAIDYYKIGRRDDAVAVLDLAPQHPIVDVWWSFLKFSQDSTIALEYVLNQEDLSPDLVFPYRLETLKVLQWANGKSDLWKIKYYLALNYWGLGRDREALEILNGMQENVHYAPLYTTRAHLRKQLDQDPRSDFEHALQINKNDWRSWHQLISFYGEKGLNEKMLVASKEAFERIPDSYVMGMHYARALLSDKKYLASIDVLKSINVLPYEGASQGRKLWQEANLAAARDFMREQNWIKAIDLLQDSKDWPENLGVGQPFDPDLRLSDYLLAKCYDKLGKSDLAKQHLESVENYHASDPLQPELNDLINIKIDREKNRSSSFLEKLDDSGNKILVNYLKAYERGDQKEMTQIEEKHSARFSGDLFDVLKFAIDLD